MQGLKPCWISSPRRKAGRNHPGEEAFRHGRSALCRAGGSFPDAPGGRIAAWLRRHRRRLPCRRHTRSGGREPWYPRGTEMRNERQLSIVAADELAIVAERMGLAEIKPEWIGANLVIDGVPHLSMLPSGTLLFFKGGVTIKVDAQNGPCRIAGRSIAENAGMADLEAGALLFPEGGQAAARSGRLGRESRARSWPAKSFRCGCRSSGFIGLTWAGYAAHAAAQPACRPSRLRPCGSCSAPCAMIGHVVPFFPERDAVGVFLLDHRQADIAEEHPQRRLRRIDDCQHRRAGRLGIAGTDVGAALGHLGAGRLIGRRSAWRPWPTRRPNRWRSRPARPA